MPERIHPVEIPGCNMTLQQIGEEIARLRYDAHPVIFKAYRDELRRQAVADLGRSRTLLAEALFDAVDRISPLLIRIERAWKLSKPHMATELTQTPELK
jgi:hypothetical protein